MSGFRRIRVCILLVVLSTTIHPCDGQQILNLDFEQLSVEGIARPWGWSVYAYAPGVSFHCDSLNVYNGKHSLKVYGDTKEGNSRFELSFFVEPNQVLNTEIGLEGWISAKNFNGNSGIEIQSIGLRGDEYGVLHKDSTSIRESVDWKQLRTKINIDSRPHSVLVTLFFEGSGTVWFDHLQLSVNGERVDEVPVAKSFSAEQLKIIRKNSSSFKTVEPSLGTTLHDSEFRDLNFFKEIVGDARIIALGESTHGTSEFFKLKHRLLQYAILDLGVRVFVLEDNQLLVEHINDYVLYGRGAPENVIKGLFAVWNTEEMFHLIKWLRNYNRENPDRMVEFVGMDVQNPQLALDQLEEFLTSRDDNLQSESKLLLSDIRANWRNSYFLEDSVLLRWDEEAGMNFIMADNKKEEWLSEAENKSDTIEIEWAIKNARTVKQYTETILGGIYEGRDKAMAENIDWILNQRHPETKILIWAHDSHISRGEAPEPNANFFSGKSMGSYLSKKYEEDYRAFGLFTYRGTCLGTISYSDFTQRPFQIYTSPEGSLDEALHLISQNLTSPNLLTDLRPFKNDLPEYKWLNEKRPVRYVGYVAEDYGFGGRYRVPYQFDGILFMDTTTATTDID